MANPTIASSASTSYIRPKHAAVSCAHLWALLLLVAGIAEFILGTMLFAEWKGVGSWWIGAIAIGTGIAGVNVSGAHPSGGWATGFLLLLSVVTVASAIAMIALADGIAYLVVRETEGNCISTDECPQDYCGDSDCMCWKPDESSPCAPGSSVRYCFQYGGDSCADIEASEGLLMGSSAMLVIIGFLSFCSFLVAISTCWFCKRVIVVESTNEESPS